MFCFQVASAMVACTFLSAPLMFTSARMVLASSLEIKKAASVLKSFDLDLSIAGIILSVIIGHGFLLHILCIYVFT